MTPASSWALLGIVLVALPVCVVMLLNPRPLTPAEYAEYGIPAPCTHATDEKTAQRTKGTTP